MDDDRYENAATRIAELLQTQSAVSITVSDGQVLFFRRDVITRLLNTMDESGQDVVSLFIMRGWMH